MAMWSQKVKQSMRTQQDKEFRERTAERLRPVIEERLRIVKLLRWNQWQVQVILPLPIGWHWCDVVPCEDTAALREVDFVVKPPGSAAMVVRGITALQRKAIGMR